MGEPNLRPLIELGSAEHGLRAILVVSHERVRRALAELAEFGIHEGQQETPAWQAAFRAWSHLERAASELETSHAILYGSVEYGEADLRESGWLPESEVADKCGVKLKTVQKWRGSAEGSGLKWIELQDEQGERSFWLNRDSLPDRHRKKFVAPEAG